jgi:hypothetical protein
LQVPDTGQILSPVVYLLCELKNRDPHSRLLIANHVTAAGHGVMLATLSFIRPQR